MANLGTLSLMLKARSAQFKRAMTQSTMQVKSMGSTAKVAAGSLLRYTAAFAAIGVVGLVAARHSMKMEDQLARVSTMLDAGAMKVLPGYKIALRNMAEQFGESTESLSKGLYDILSASVPAGQALGVLDISAKAAVAGLTDTGVAADAITTILNAYSMKVSEAGRVSDVMFAIVKRGKTTFAELAPSIGRVMSTAAIAGLKLEEVGAAMATMTRAGINTNESVTALNGMLRAFLNPTEDGIAAARELGFELNTLALREEGLVGIMQRMSSASVEQLAAISPSIRGMKGFAAALQNTEGFAEDYAIMLNSAGMRQEAFDKITKTTSFGLKQMRASLGNVVSELGESLLPALQWVGEAFTKIRVSGVSFTTQLIGMWLELGKMWSGFTTSMLTDWDGFIIGMRKGYVYLKVGFVSLIGVIVGSFSAALDFMMSGVNRLIRGINKIPKIYIPEFEFKATETFMDPFLDKVEGYKQDVEGLEAEFAGKAATRMGKHAAYVQLMDAAQEQLYAGYLEKMNLAREGKAPEDAGGSGVDPAERQRLLDERRRQGAMMAEGRRITEQMRGPLEVYTAEVEKLGALVDSGAVSQMVHARAVDAAYARLQEARGEETGFGQEAAGTFASARIEAIVGTNRAEERTANATERTAGALESMMKSGEVNWAWMFGAE